MSEVMQKLSQYDFLINAISCVITVLALVFTLYFWLLDHLSEDESKFIEGKEKFIKSLRRCLETIKSDGEPEQLLTMVQNVNNQLEVILNYRFWARSKKKADYKLINEFYLDSKYLISTIRRYMEAQEAAGDQPQTGRSLVSIPSLSPEELEDIKSDYRKGLTYIIDFIENWN